jgi:uncharacterized phiE125 gp8 family phage protein
LALHLITPPAAPAITLADAKLHLRVDHDHEDAWITAAIQAATLAAEHETGRRFVNQTWEAVYDGFGCSGAIKLGLAPVVSITSFSYINKSGALVTASSDGFVLDTVQSHGIGYVLPAAGYPWPATASTINAVRIRFVVGYGPDHQTVPAVARLWMLQHIGTAFAARESIAIGQSVAALPSRYHDALLDSLRVYDI